MTDQRSVAMGVTCPNCNAHPGEPCTAPTSTGRREVKWVHHAREGAAVSAAARVAESISETCLKEDVELECSACGQECDAAEPVRVRALLEHCAYDHLSRADVLIRRTSTLMSGFELGSLLGSQPATVAEERWREERKKGLR